MSAERITLDTNILIYSLDRQAKEKHQQSIEIIQKALSLDCLLTLQSLSEFYSATTRKKLLPTKIAGEQIQDWLALFPVATAKPNTLTKAINMCHAHCLSFWDAMLLATARDAGVTLVLSEDFNHSQTIDGIKIINPFMFNNIEDIFIS